MSVYLQDIPLPDAMERLEQALRDAGKWGLLSSEEIPLDEFAAGRVLSEPVWAKISSPHYHASAMDGFAVRAEETAGAGGTPVPQPADKKAPPAPAAPVSAYTLGEIVTRIKAIKTKKMPSFALPLTFRVFIVHPPAYKVTHHSHQSSVDISH